MIQSLIEAKMALRAQAAARRAELSAAFRTQASGAIAVNLLRAIPIGDDTVVSAYSAMGDEADHMPLLEALHARGVCVALPRVAGPKRTPLVFHRYEPGMALVRGGFGLLQPGADWPEVTPAVLAVPLLAFDKDGYRLGYGGGYYDSTLAKLRQTSAIVAAGFAFAAQETDFVPRDAFDQRLDWVVTEQEARAFES